MDPTKKRWRISGNFYDIDLLPWHFIAPWESESMLTPRHDIVDRIDRFTLVDIWNEISLSCLDYSRISTHDLREMVFHSLESRKLIALRVERPDYLVRAVAKPKEEAPAPVEAIREVQTHWIAVQLVDSDGRPVAGTRYSVTASDGIERSGALDAMGYARVEELPSGDCKVIFPGYDSSAVQKGESIQ